MKPNFILDLDQTLISAEAIDNFDHDKFKSKTKKFKKVQMENYYHVFERPHLQKFLDFLFEHFNVSIWTAASKDYALFIIEKVVLAGKRNRKIDYIFFSYHCNASEKHKRGTKDLSMIWDIYKLPGYDKSNTVILDDYDEVYNTQNDNCIIAKAFEFTADSSENDKFLKELKAKLTSILKGRRYKDKFASSVKKINKDLQTV